MSKLREKFDLKINRYKEEHLSEQCEQITDDFSVKFAEWMDKECRKSHSHALRYWLLGELKTTQELLQIFKDKYYE